MGRWSLIEEKIIEMKDNILKLKDCYGCGVCVMACPKKIISLELNKDGFYSPAIHNQADCIECGVCLDICGFNHDETANSDRPFDIKAYGCLSKDDDIRANCTTGGMGYEIARKAVENGYKACVVEYDIENRRAQHYIADSVESLSKAKGSKYIPSWTEPGYKGIKLKDKNIVFGLPCQIDSFRRLIRKFKVEQNFQLVDLLCYGTPSLNLWRNYADSLAKQTGDIEKVKFRSKAYGWHNLACVEIDGKKKRLIQTAEHCDFYRIFFSDSCLNKCCHGGCKYKLLKSSADIRIGDYWGRKYSENDSGVNVLLSLTSVGDGMIANLQSRCIFEHSSLEDAMDKQMAHNAPYSPGRWFVLWGFRKKIPLKYIFYTIKMVESTLHPIETAEKIINRMRLR